MRQEVWIPLLILLAWGTVARAMLVYAHKLPATCTRCGLRFERQSLGQPVCRCNS